MLRVRASFSALLDLKINYSVDISNINVVFIIDYGIFVDVILSLNGSVVEHFLGKEKVVSPILTLGS